MKKHNAFTMLELVFVIVIIGIIGKFGVEFMTQAYQNYMSSNINNRLQADSASAVEFIAKRLQYRIKNSAIARNPNPPTTFTSIQNGAQANTVIEWIGSDIDGFRGTDRPYWSGIIDVRHNSRGTNMLISPDMNQSLETNLILALSYGTNNIDNAALYFIGSGGNTNQFYWRNAPAAPIATQTQAMHPINSANNEQFTSGTGAIDFIGIEIYEYYKLAWTAYAISHTDSDADGNLDLLTLHYNYQPWQGDTYLFQVDGVTATNSAIIMQNVTTFRFAAIGSMIKIQVCVGSDILQAGDYSICKEKAIY